MSENEVVEGLLDRLWGGRWWLGSPSGKGTKMRVKENEVEVFGWVVRWFDLSERVKRPQFFTKCFGGNRRVLEGIQQIFIVTTF